MRRRHSPPQPSTSLTRLLGNTSVSETAPSSTSSPASSAPVAASVLQSTSWAEHEADLVPAGRRGEPAVEQLEVRSEALVLQSADRAKNEAALALAGRVDEPAMERLEERKEARREGPCGVAVTYTMFITASHLAKN